MVVSGRVVPERDVPGIAEEGATGARVSRVPPTEGPRVAAMGASRRVAFRLLRLVAMSSSFGVVRLLDSD
jgi:hypothetical protein